MADAGGKSVNLENGGEGAGALGLNDARVTLQYSRLGLRPKILLLYAPDVRKDFELMFEAIGGIRAELWDFDATNSDTTSLYTGFERMHTTDEVVILANPEFAKSPYGNYQLDRLATNRKAYFPLVVVSAPYDAKTLTATFETAGNVWDVAADGWARLPVFLMKKIVGRRISNP